MARVTYNSTGGKSPEVAILPNATGGTQRRNVLLKRGSSSNEGDNIFIIEEGHLRKKQMNELTTVTHFKPITLAPGFLVIVLHTSQTSYSLLPFIPVAPFSHCLGRKSICAPPGVIFRFRFLHE